MGRLTPPAAAVVAGSLLLAACIGATSGARSDTGTSNLGTSSAGRSEAEYPDAIRRHLDRLASAPRPVERSALPPRHLDVETFPVSLVDRTRIVSGGPPPDGIPPIDEPRFEPATAVDWIEPTEPVLALLVEGRARAYPVQVLIWHEIVNDEIGGRPVAVTYCPLCDSGVAFDRRVGDEVLDFGTSGGLYQANLVMYDRQTESLWTQFDGRSVVGTLTGEQLDSLPLDKIAWRDFLREHPDGSVLARDETNPRPYGRNPYAAYDQRTAPVAGFYSGEPDAALAPYARVVGIETGGEALAIPTRSLAERGVVPVDVAGRRLSVWHMPGATSALGDRDIAGGDDIGSTAVFVAEVDSTHAAFDRSGDLFVDDITGSGWNVLGEAVEGPLRGERLDPIVHVDTFWFAWSTFHVDGALYDPSGAG